MKLAVATLYGCLVFSITDQCVEIGPAEETEYDKVGFRQTWTEDHGPEYYGTQGDYQEVDHKSSYQLSQQSVECADSQAYFQRPSLG